MHARLLALLACPLVACATPAPPPPTPPAAASAAPVARPPVAAVRPVVNEYHGVRVTDDYQWLERSGDPEVDAFSAAENAWARRHLDALPGRDAIRARARELLGAASAEHRSLAARGGRLFALEDKPPRQQPTLVVMPSADEPERARTLVDPNQLDPSGKLTVDFFAPSPDGRRVAVSLSAGGSEDGTVHVYDVETGKATGDVIPRVNGGTAGGSLAWSGDGSGFYYTRYPRAGERPPADLDFYQQAYFHRLGTPEKDDRYELGKELPRIAEIELETSDDGRSVLAVVQNGDGGEHEVHLRAPSGAWAKVAGFRDGIKAAHFGGDGRLYVHSVAGAPRGKLLALDAGATDLAGARIVLPEGEAVIQRFAAGKSKLYVSELLGGPSVLRVVDLAPAGRGAKGKGAEAAPPKSTLVPTLPVSTVGQLLVTHGDDLLFRNPSYLSPPAWFRYSAETGKTQPTALRVASPASFADAEVVRDTCASPDGTKVPMSILRRKGIALDGSHPVLLGGYGGYGVSRSPRFNPIDRLFLDKGGVVVATNLRGGGELGEAWHRAGMLTKKQNVFDDFVACARRLLEAGYTRPERLGIIGGSNGGLLMGAALTQHPELFRVAVSYVGIYDMLRVELTPNGAFNVTEFGTVKDEAQFRSLFAYSPYHRVAPGTRYPAALFLTGKNDPRVDPFHSRKMVARLQAADAGGRPILLRTSDDTGHGIGTPLAAEIEEHVDVYSFLYRELGMN